MGPITDAHKTTLSSGRFRETMRHTRILTCRALQTHQKWLAIASTTKTVGTSSALAKAAAETFN